MEALASDLRRETLEASKDTQHVLNPEADRSSGVNGTDSDASFISPSEGWAWIMQWWEERGLAQHDDENESPPSSPPPSPSTPSSEPSPLVDGIHSKRRVYDLSNYGIGLSIDFSL